MQPIANLGILDLTQPAIDMEHKLIECFLVWSRIHTKIMIELRRLNKSPDFTTQRWSLRWIHGIHLGVFIEQLLEPRDITVALRARHRRHKMINNRGVRPPLCLSSLPGVIDQEWVNQRQ